MPAVLKAENLSKRYGSVQALEQVSFSLNQGEALGILGPNGSGKTTALGIISDIIAPDTGSYHWHLGASPRLQIGTLLETPNFLQHMNGADALKTVCLIREQPFSEIEKVLEKTGLSDAAGRKISGYSLGMKQRLAIAAALIGDPRVLVLDEPTNGLDPQGIAEIRELILSLRDEGRTLLMASHILGEVEKTCTHTLVLREGKVLAYSPVEEIETDNLLFTALCNDHTELLKVVKGFRAHINSEIRDNKVYITLEKNTDGADLNRYLAEKGIYLSELTRIRSSLEDQFLKLIKEGDS